MFHIDTKTLVQLGSSLMAARKEQKLSRAELSAVSGLSVSFIRDAESQAGNCSLKNLTQLVQSLGLQIQINGLSSPESESALDHSNTHLSQLARLRAAHGLGTPSSVTRKVVLVKRGESSPVKDEPVPTRRKVTFFVNPGDKQK